MRIFCNYLEFWRLSSATKNLLIICLAMLSSSIGERAHQVVAIKDEGDDLEHHFLHHEQGLQDKDVTLESLKIWQLPK